jgi:hypothetical protein
MAWLFAFASAMLTRSGELAESAAADLSPGAGLAEAEASTPGAAGAETPADVGAGESATGAATAKLSVPVTGWPSADTTR